MLGLVAFVMLVGSGTAWAKTERLHGVVLALLPKDGQAIVHHDAFGSMPSMTMPFQIVPRSQVATLQVGNTIDATVDRSTEPWTLRDVRVSSTLPVTAQPDVLRRVFPLQIGDIVPDTPFFDQTGRPFRFSQLRGQDVVLAFIYTRCQDPRMCPLISAKFNALQARIGKRPMHLVEVTLDPSYDRPPVLARYGQTFGANPRDWTLAVGDADPTLNFAARFGISVFPDPVAGLIHTENTIEIGPDGRVSNEITETSWQPDEIIADIDKSRAEAANPIARFDLWLSRTATAIFGNTVAAFNGLTDLAVGLLIFASCGYLVFRLARRIAKNA
ncbi:MAG: SCO family protein [Candidatus Lustribacter sp.]|jgi:cytochrome oxidase Cu insertion factor (SCO1/SenC/PrrC family)/Cu/Ag efflux protein CusF